MTVDDDRGGEQQAPRSLLWAQQYHWSHYRSAPPGERWRDNVRSAVPVPDGVTTDEILRVLRDLVATHEALRTTYRPAGAGEIAAWLGPGFDPPVDIREIDGAEPVERWALRYFDELHERDFELESHPQVRFGIAVQDGVPRWLLFMFHHIAIDTYGVMAFQRDLARALDPSGAPRPALPQPSAELARQQSPSGRRADERAQAYLADVAARFPASTVPVRVGAAREPRLMQAALDSDAGGLVRELARRFRAPESAVVMGVFAAAVCHVTGNRRTALRVSSSNRFQPEQIDFVGCCAQTLPLLLTPPLDVPLAQLVGYAKRALTPVYRHGWHDHWQAREELLRAQFSRGAGTEAMIAFNYVDRSAERQNFSRIEEQEAYITGPKGRAVISPVKADFADHLGLFVRRSADRLTLSIRHDAALLDEEWVERFLVGLHDLLPASGRPGAVVRDLLEAADLPPLPTGGRWAVRGGCRVSLDDIEALLSTHPAVRACRVTAAGPGGGLVAHVVAPSADAFALRCHLAARLRSWPAAVIPDHFAFVAHQDALPGDRSPADAPTPDALATGHEGPPFATDTPQAEALAAALAAVHPEAGWSGAWSYIGAGGRLSRIDAVLDALNSRGVSGLTYSDLYHAAPPGELLAKLRIG